MGLASFLGLIIIGGDQRNTVIMEGQEQEVYLIRNRIHPSLDQINRCEWWSVSKVWMFRVQTRAGDNQKPAVSSTLKSSRTRAEIMLRHLKQRRAHSSSHRSGSRAGNPTSASLYFHSLISQCLHWLNKMAKWPVGEPRQCLLQRWASWAIELS